MRYVGFAQLILYTAIGAAVPALLKRAIPKATPHQRKTNTAATSLAVPVELAVLLIYDIKITKGKTCAQVGHAISEALDSDRELVYAWKGQGSKVVFHKIADFEACRGKVEVAQKFPMPAGFICDAGHTQVAPGTVTVGWILGERAMLAQLMEDEPGKK